MRVFFFYRYLREMLFHGLNHARVFVIKLQRHGTGFLSVKDIVECRATPNLRELRRISICIEFGSWI